MPDVRAELSSYREVLDDRAPEVTLAEVTSREVAPLRPRRSPWPVFAASLAVALAVGLVLFLNQSGETTPTETVVPTTVVDPTPTTVATPTTTPSTQDADSTGDEDVVGDDVIVVAMAQSFPLNPEPDSAFAEGPDLARGRTAGTGFTGLVEESGTAVSLRRFGVSFMAFEIDQLASEFVIDQKVEDPREPAQLILETFDFPDLGEEATGSFRFNRGRAGGSTAYVTVRRGRFVVQAFVNVDVGLTSDTVDGFDAANNPLVGESLEWLRAIAGIADETMQTVLASDIQPLAPPTPETLTSYRMEAWVYPGSAAPTEVESIVTPEGYGCRYSTDQEAWLGVAEIGDDAFQQVDSNEGWLPSTADSPGFQSGKDFCRTWSPHLEESYLGDLIKLREGHVGIDNGRRTLSYWFTKDDLIEAGVLTASDNIADVDLQMIVDQAGPWLVDLSVSLDGDTDAIDKVIRLEVPDLETASSFTISIDYGSIDDGTETWTDRLREMIQPAP